jgi:ketosteroid isomerase-like protein
MASRTSTTATTATRTCGNRGVSEWTIRGTQRTGEHIEVRGCDLFEFTDGKISRKDAYWKIID